ncbi:MAG: hypothetical protein GXO83_02530, partial [Chlorobi bacterium]|nr:hypothetical protein [Chlorobiota bacterium]
DGTAVYTETFNPVTNDFGLFTLEIGNGTVVSGNFAAIDWTAGPYFLKVEMDAAGGTDYTDMGTTQLLSVPYALHAKTAGSVTGTITETDPVFTSSQAANITAGDITNLGNLSGVNTGDQDLSTYATHLMLTDTAAILRSQFPDVSGFITAETDPVFATSPSNSITGTEITNWNTAYGWGNHAGAGYDTSSDSWAGDSTTYTMWNTGIKTVPSLINLQVGKNYAPFFDHSFQDIDTSKDRTFMISGLWDTHSHSKGMVYLAGNWVDHDSVTGSITFVSGAWENAAIQGREGNNTDWSGDLVFLTRHDENPLTEQMRITEDGNVGIGIQSPAEKLDVNGNAHIAGDLIVDGILTANIHIDTVDVSQITGLLGQGYTLAFPDIVDNYTSINIGNIGSSNAVILHGPGYDIERIESYNLAGERDDLPGLSMEHPIIFEVDNSNPAFLNSLISWFDESNPAPDSVTIIIKNNGGEESIHWNSYNFRPDGYVQGVDDRIRFTLVNASLPDHLADHTLAGDPFGTQASINPETDKGEILFDGEKLQYPAFSEDTASHFITLTWDFIEAHNVWPYFLKYVVGYDHKFQVIVAFVNDHGGVTQWTYDGCFPVKMEQTTGFGLDLKTKISVKIWYVRKRIA